MIYPSLNMLNGNPEKDYINEAEKKETKTTKAKYCGYEINIVTEPQIFNPPKDMLVWNFIDDVKIRKVWAIAPKEAGYRMPVHCVLFGECYESCAELPQEMLKETIAPAEFLGVKRQEKKLQDGSSLFFYEVMGGTLCAGSDGGVTKMIFKYNDTQSKEEIKNEAKINKEEFEKTAIRLINNVMNFLLIKKNLY
jgi:hypothetical protein